MMPDHIFRLLVILGVAITGAITAKYWFTAPTFGEYGHYRAASLEDITAQQPLHRGPAYCASCHTERVTFWKAGRHTGVQCEICHGPAGEHPATGKLPIPSMTVALCSSCHESLPARPAASIKQVIIAEHMGEQACIECHNPHSPTHFKWDDIQGTLTSPTISRHHG